MKTTAKIISIVVSILLVLGVIFSTEANLNLINNVCLYILAGIYLYCIMYFVIYKCFLKNKTIDSKQVFITVIVSVGFVVFMPFHYSEMVKQNRIQKIEQEETSIQISPGSKNANSKNNEIYIESIKIEQNDYNMYEIELTDGWEFVDGRPYTNQMDAKPIQINFNKNADVEIYVRKNANSGMINIKYCGFEKDFDLYSEKEIKKERINLDSVIPLEILHTRVGVRCAIYYICYGIITSTVVFIVISLLFRKTKTDKLIKKKEN